MSAVSRGPTIGLHVKLTQGPTVGYMFIVCKSHICVYHRGQDLLELTGCNISCSKCWTV